MFPICCTRPSIEEGIEKIRQQFFMYVFQAYIMDSISFYIVLGLRLICT